MPDLALKGWQDCIIELYEKGNNYDSYLTDEETEAHRAKSISIPK